jgi:hypothetical protein
VENREEVERMISQMDKSIETKGLWVKQEATGVKPSRKRRRRNPKDKKLSMDSKSESTVFINLKTPSA